MPCNPSRLVTSGQYKTPDVANGSRPQERAGSALSPRTVGAPIAPLAGVRGGAPHVATQAPAVRLAYGGRPDHPARARTNQYRRCAACRWVYPAASFRVDRRRLGTACELCRGDRRAAKRRRAA